ncbi:hypothetical protein B0H14DRAFT_3718759 [Mycena olivaceomarginata]|nr:hypothetical protein B0H14DRAFT_3718759 [Mycena olivaceomarginata]
MRSATPSNTNAYARTDTFTRHLLADRNYPRPSAPRRRTAGWLLTNRHQHTGGHATHSPITRTPALCVADLQSVTRDPGGTVVLSVPTIRLDPRRRVAPATEQRTPRPRSLPYGYAATATGALSHRLRGRSQAPQSLPLLLLLLKHRPAPTRARGCAHPERILAVREPNPPTLDQPPERVPIELIQSLGRPRATIEPCPWRCRRRLCRPWIVRAAPPHPEAMSTVQRPGLGPTPFYYPIPATACHSPLPAPQQRPTQNHHTRSRSLLIPGVPWSGPGPMPAPAPQPMCTHSYSVQLPPPLLQQVRANSYPYVPAYPPAPVRQRAAAGVPAAAPQPYNAGLGYVSQMLNMYASNLSSIASFGQPNRTATMYFIPYHAPPAADLFSHKSGHVFDLASHPFGCRVLERCIEHLPDVLETVFPKPCKDLLAIEGPPANTRLSKASDLPPPGREANAMWASTKNQVVPAPFAMEPWVSSTALISVRPHPLPDNNGDTLFAERGPAHRHDFVCERVHALGDADVHHNQLQRQPDVLTDYNDRHGDVQRHAELAFVPRAGEHEYARRVAVIIRGLQSQSGSGSGSGSEGTYSSYSYVSNISTGTVTGTTFSRARDVLRRLGWGDDKENSSAGPSDGGNGAGGSGTGTGTGSGATPVTYSTNQTGSELSLGPLPSQGKSSSESEYTIVPRPLSSVASSYESFPTSYASWTAELLLLRARKYEHDVITVHHWRTKMVVGCEARSIPGTSAKLKVQVPGFSDDGPFDHYETLLYSTSMGIDGLWKELEPVEQKVSLDNLAVGTGFIANATGRHGFRVGIDASGWMYRACYRHGSLESPELVALFARSPQRQARQAHQRKRPLVNELLQADVGWFGFDWLVAPGEAEATLSMMTTNGVPVRVDAIITDDSDSFVFGASVVLRMIMRISRPRATSAFDISTMLGLTRDDFVLIALLAGGDYSDGLRNCGVTTAIGLARAGLGRQLVSGLSGRSRLESTMFLETWRETLRSELRTNASGHLSHRYNQLASNIPADFPDLDVVNLYLHPIVVEGPTTKTLTYRPPRLNILARFAEDHFGWGHGVGILTHFAERLFPGLVIRELTHRALAIDEGAPPPQSASLIKSIVGNRSHKSTGYLAELRLTLNLDPNILTSALHAITGRRDPGEGSQTTVAAWLTSILPKVRVWVPKAMLEHVSPAIVLDYICVQSNRPGRKRERLLQPAINASHPSIPSSSSVAPANQEGHVMSLALNRRQSSTSSEVKNGLRRVHETRYTIMNTTYEGKEVLELISDSDGEF